MPKVYFSVGTAVAAVVAAAVGAAVGVAVAHAESIIVDRNITAMSMFPTFILFIVAFLLFINFTLCVIG
jgi:hypothetical protein